MIQGLLLGLSCRALLSILGASKLEGFIIAFVVLNQQSLDLTIGFFIGFIGTKALSIPADVFVITNRRQDPVWNDLKTIMVNNGLGHVLVKQLAMTNAIITSSLLLICAIAVGIMKRDMAIISILLSPFAIIALQIIVMISKSRFEKEWKWKYLIGVFIYTCFALTFSSLNKDGYGMLIVANLVFLNLSDIWPKEKLNNQQKPNKQEWGDISISQAGIMSGMLSSYFIGCPTSLLSTAITEGESIKSKLQTMSIASAISDSMQLGLWLMFGFSRSSYADALSKSNISLDPNSAVSFALGIIILTWVTIQFIQEWSLLYFSIIKTVGKLLNLVCTIAALVACCLFINPIYLILGLVTILGLNQIRVPNESKLGMFSAIPLISINWLQFI